MPIHRPSDLERERRRRMGAFVELFYQYLQDPESFEQKDYSKTERGDEAKARLIMEHSKCPV